MSYAAVALLQSRRIIGLCFMAIQSAAKSGDTTALTKYALLAGKRVRLYMSAYRALSAKIYFAAISSSSMPLRLPLFEEAPALLDARASILCVDDTPPEHITDI